MCTMVSVVCVWAQCGGIHSQAKRGLTEFPKQLVSRTRLYTFTLESPNFIHLLSKATKQILNPIMTTPFPPKTHGVKMSSTECQPNMHITPGSVERGQHTCHAGNTFAAFMSECLCHRLSSGRPRRGKWASLRAWEDLVLPTKSPVAFYEKQGKSQESLNLRIRLGPHHP